MITLLALSAWADEVHRYSLLVGTNDGGGDRVALRYAHSDALTLGEVLVDVGGVDPARQRVLLDPDSASLAEAFEALQVELAADPARTEVVFYYSGHSDEEGLLLGEERYTYPELRAALEALPARVRVAILDSCASGALILSKGGRKIAPFLVDQSVTVDGFAYITSSSADEVSQEAERVGGSYFTYYLETGLRGAADSSDDGRVTLTEAYTFAYDETLARTERTQHGPQHPTYQIELSGTGDLVLTDLSQNASSLVLEEAIDGRALVRDAEGHLVAELDKPAGRRVEIALAEGDYEVTLVPDDEGTWALAEVELVAGADTVVLADALDWHEGESTLTRGGGAPIAVVVSGEERTDRVPFRLTLGVEPPPEGPDTLLLSLVGGHASALEGAAVGVGWIQVDGHAKSLVTALGATSAGALDGAQVSLAGNVVRDSGSGVQAALGANFVGTDAGSEGFDGVQVALGLNEATRGIRGAQLGLGVNIAGDGFTGLQLSGLNAAGGFSEGLQLGMLNVAPDLDGVQLGLLNRGRDVRGLQLGLVNSGRKVSTQLGLVNFSKDAATPIGLLSFVKEGRHDVMAYASESDPLNAELRLGGRYFYNVLGGGGGTGKAYAAYGIGLHAPFLAEKGWLDTDAVLASYLDQDGGWLDLPTGVVRGRVTLGAQPLEALGVYAGASVNGYVPVEDLAPIAVAPDWISRDDGTLLVWPGFFAGLSLSL